MQVDFADTAQAESPATGDEGADRANMHHRGDE